MPIDPNDLLPLRELLYSNGCFCLFLSMSPEDAVTPFLSEIEEPQHPFGVSFSAHEKSTIVKLLGGLDKVERQLFTRREHEGIEQEGHPSNVLVKKAIDRMHAEERLRLSCQNAEMEAEKSSVDDDLRIERVDVRRDESSEYQCRQCNSNVGEFQVAFWYTKDFDCEPEVESLCGVCLAVTFLQETSAQSVTLEKYGSGISVRIATES